MAWSFGTPWPSDGSLTSSQSASGEPNFLVGLADAPNTLAYFKFHVDWSNPANTTLDGPSNLAVDPFTQSCSTSFGVCIPQLGTSQKLDSLGDRVMNRLAYR